MKKIFDAFVEEMVEHKYLWLFVNVMLTTMWITLILTEVFNGD